MLHHAAIAKSGIRNPSCAGVAPATGVNIACNSDAAIVNVLERKKTQPISAARNIAGCRTAAGTRSHGAENRRYADKRKP